MLNQVALTGRITQDAKLTEFGDNRAVANFGIAVNRPKTKNGTTLTDFIDCCVWDQRAKKLAPYLVKGRLVGVTGQLRIRPTMTKEGQKRTYTNVNVDDLVFFSGPPRRATGEDSQQAVTSSKTSPDPFDSPDAFAKTDAKADIATDDLPF